MTPVLSAVEGGNRYLEAFRRLEDLEGFEPDGQGAVLTVNQVVAVDDGAENDQLGGKRPVDSVRKGFCRREGMKVSGHLLDNIPVLGVLQLDDDRAPGDTGRKNVADLAIDLKLPGNQVKAPELVQMPGDENLQGGLAGEPVTLSVWYQHAEKPSFKGKEKAKPMTSPFPIRNIQEIALFATLGREQDEHAVLEERDGPTVLDLLVEGFGFPTGKTMATFGPEFA